MNDSTTAGILELKRKEVLKKKPRLLKTGFLLCTVTTEKVATKWGLHLVKMWINLTGEHPNWDHHWKSCCSLKATAQKGASPGSAHSRCYKCGPWKTWFQASSQVGRKTWQPWPHAAGFTGIKVVRTDCIFKSWSLWRVGSCPQGPFLACLAECKVSLQLY